MTITRRRKDVVQFNEGEHVVCVRDDRDNILTKGHTYHIKRIVWTIGSIQVEGSRRWWNPDRFEPIKKTHFEDKLFEIQI